MTQDFKTGGQSETMLISNGQIPIKLETTMSDRVKEQIKKNLLLILTLVAVALGFATGFGIRPLKPSSDAIMWLGMPGELFMRALKMMILPLITCSVLAGTATLDPKSNGKISLVALVYVFATHIVCGTLGVVLAVLIEPGNYGVAVAWAKTGRRFETQDIFADLLRNLVPSNIMEACFRQAQTRYEKVENFYNSTNSTTEVVMTFTKSVGSTEGANVLGLIVVCLLIGISTNQAGSKGKPFLKFFQSATDVFMIILKWLLWLTPVGVASLICVSIAKVADPEETFKKTGMFVLAVTAGIFIHQVILMPILLFLLTRRNPLKFFLDILPPWLIGFATTSTAVALPEMIHACEDKQKIDGKVTRFTLPFCVSLNADGSVLYIVVAAVFLSQFTGFPLTIGNYIVIVFLTSIAGMAIPSVPSASIVVLVVVLTSLNIPAGGISLLFSVEWFLDRIRTTSNEAPTIPSCIGNGGLLIRSITSAICSCTLIYLPLTTDRWVIPLYGLWSQRIKGAVEAPKRVQAQKSQKRDLK